MTTTATLTERYISATIRRNRTPQEAEPAPA